jgi:hypothetical protein
MVSKRVLVLVLSSMIKYRWYLLVSQQPVCGRGETRVRQARVKESRYVIKVMSVKWKMERGNNS